MAKKNSGRRTGTGRSKSVSAKRSAARPAAPRGRGAQLVPVICSECHEDLLYDSSVNSDGLMCPICEHSALKPDGAQLHHIAEKIRQEKSAFMITAVLSAVAGVSFVAWALLMKNPANQLDDGMFWGPLGISLLSTLVLVIFIAKYEGNRWEVYF